MQICILVNSVEHVLLYLQELPQQMQWTEILNESYDVSTDSDLKDQVLRILKLIQESMNVHISEIITRILKSIVYGIHNIVEKVFHAWLQPQATYQVSFSFFFSLVIFSYAHRIILCTDYFKIRIPFRKANRPYRTIFTHGR